MNLFDEFTGIDDSYFFSDPFLADLGQAQGRFQSNSTAMQTPTLESSSGSYQLTTNSFDGEEGRMMCSSMEVDHGVESSLGLAEQAFQQITSVPQCNMHAQRGMTTYLGTGINGWAESSPPPHDDDHQMVQPDVSNAAQQVIANAQNVNYKVLDTSTTHTHPAAASAPLSKSSVIGHIHFSNDAKGLVFQCIHPRCRSKSFRRPYEFDRHYNSAHAIVKTMFWCPVEGCSRSNGHRPFPRKHRMMDHAWKIHGIDGGGEVNVTTSQT